MPSAAVGKQRPHSEDLPSHTSRDADREHLLAPRRLHATLPQPLGISDASNAILHLTLLGHQFQTQSHRLSQSILTLL